MRVCEYAMILVKCLFNNFRLKIFALITLFIHMIHIENLLYLELRLSSNHRHKYMNKLAYDQVTKSVL